MALVFIVLGGLIEFGFIAFTGYAYFIGEMKMTMLLLVITLVYTVFYVMLLFVMEATSFGAPKSSSSSSGDFDCDMGDADCGDGGGGFSGGD